MNDSALSQRLDQLTPMLVAVCHSLRDEVHRLGFPQSEVPIRDIAEALFRLENDTASGEACLIGEWRDDHGIKLGELIFHADGSFFAEHDVIREHPSRRGFFVEAVTAWGRDATIKSEPRLLPMAN